MSLSVDFQFACSAGPLPEKREFRRWLTACLKAVGRNGRGDRHEVTIRIVDKAEITALNRQYRHKNYATNVLSFPADHPAELGIPFLGDIVICADVVQEEAAEQQKTAAAHWAHMSVHGMLHLLGFDHMDEEEAEAMERLETAILLETGFPAPYIDHPVATIDRP
jgi:probable rRNA maturation factor